MIILQLTKQQLVTFKVPTQSAFRSESLLCKQSDASDIMLSILVASMRRQRTLTEYLTERTAKVLNWESRKRKKIRSVLKKNLRFLDLLVSTMPMSPMLNFQMLFSLLTRCAKTFAKSSTLETTSSILLATIKFQST